MRPEYLTLLYNLDIKHLYTVDQHLGVHGQPVDRPLQLLIVDLHLVADLQQEVDLQQEADLQQEVDHLPEVDLQPEVAHQPEVHLF